jgi:hypothetical protein
VGAPLLAMVVVIGGTSRLSGLWASRTVGCSACDHSRTFIVPACFVGFFGHFEEFFFGPDLVDRVFVNGMTIRHAFVCCLTAFRYHCGGESE